jgi:hypothetical protein
MVGYYPRRQSLVVQLVGYLYRRESKVPGSILAGPTHSDKSARICGLEYLVVLHECVMSQ